MKTRRRFPAPALLRAMLGCDRAAAMVEFTLVAPLLLGLMAGFVEFGRMLHHQHIIEKSVRDATRYLARVDVTGTVSGISCPGGGAVPADYTTAAANLAMYGNVCGTGDPLISYWTSPASITIAGPSDTTVTMPDASTFNVSVVRMTATVDYADVGFLTVIEGALDGAVQLTATHEEAHVGE